MISKKNKQQLRYLDDKSARYVGRGTAWSVRHKKENAFVTPVLSYLFGEDVIEAGRLPGEA